MIKVISIQAVEAELVETGSNEFELRLQGMTEQDVDDIIEQLNPNVCGEPIEVCDCDNCECH